MTNREAFATNLKVYARRSQVSFKLSAEEIFDMLEKAGFNMSSRKTAMYPVLRQKLIPLVGKDKAHIGAMIGMQLLYRTWYPKATDKGFNLHDYGYAHCVESGVEDEWTQLDEPVCTIIMDMNAARNSEQSSVSVGHALARHILNVRLPQKVVRGESTPDDYM